MTGQFVEAVLTFGVFGAELVLLLVAMRAVWAALPPAVRIRIRAMAERAL